MNTTAPQSPTETPQSHEQAPGGATAAGKGVTYACGGCSSRWSGVSRCSACHRTFAGLMGFDSHRRNGACLDPAGIATKAGEQVLAFRGDLWRSAQEFGNAGDLFEKGKPE